MRLVLQRARHLLAQNNILAGLCHPMIVASMTVLAGGLRLKQTHEVRIWDEVGGLK
jgi:hypothetical protein